MRGKERGAHNAAKGFHLVEAGSASQVGGGGGSKEGNEVQNGSRVGEIDSGAQPAGAGGGLNDRGKIRAGNGVVKNGRTKYYILRENSVVRTVKTERGSEFKGLVEEKSLTKGRDVHDSRLYRFDGHRVSLLVSVPGRQGARSYRYDALRSALIEQAKIIHTVATSFAPIWRRLETESALRELNTNLRGSSVDDVVQSFPECGAKESGYTEDRSPEGNEGLDVTAANPRLSVHSCLPTHHMCRKYARVRFFQYAGKDRAQFQYVQVVVHSKQNSKKLHTLTYKSQSTSSFKHGTFSLPTVIPCSALGHAFHIH